MKKNNAPFIVLTGVSVLLVGALIIDNIATVALQPQRHAAQVKTGLPLHEAKYWKVIHE